MLHRRTSVERSLGVLSSWICDVQLMRGIGKSIDGGISLSPACSPDAAEWDAKSKRQQFRFDSEVASLTWVGERTMPVPERTVARKRGMLFSECVTLRIGQV